MLETGVLGVLANGGGCRKKEMTIARKCHAGITAFRDAFKGYFTR